MLCDMAIVELQFSCFYCPHCTIYMCESYVSNVRSAHMYMAALSEAANEFAERNFATNHTWEHAEQMHRVSSVKCTIFIRRHKVAIGIRQLASMYSTVQHDRAVDTNGSQFNAPENRCRCAIVYAVAQQPHRVAKEWVINLNMLRTWVLCASLPPTVCLHVSFQPRSQNADLLFQFGSPEPHSLVRSLRMSCAAHTTTSQGSTKCISLSMLECVRFSGKDLSLKIES